MTYTAADPQEVRPIPSEGRAIRESIMRALDTLQEGERFAIVAHADLEDGELMVVGRPFDRWTFVGRLGKKWGGPLGAEASVVFAF